MCTQAQLWCTSIRAKKVVISLTLFALTAQVIQMESFRLPDAGIVVGIYTAIFQATVPITVLIINVVVVIQVRRAAIHSAANLGVQPHHQSTSAVPTIMIIATSLIYVLFVTTSGIFLIITYNDSYETWDFVSQCYTFFCALGHLVFAYNFYVYLITGKQFRSDLNKLFSRALSSAASSSSSAPLTPAAVAIVAGDAEIRRRVETDTV